MNIAFLVPRSISSPRLGPELIAGFRSTFKTPFTLLIEDYDSQDPQASSLEKTQKVLLEKDPDFFVVFGGRTNYEQTAGFLAENRKPVLFTDMGGHIPLFYRNDPFIIHNSFEVWKSSYALGEWELKEGMACGIVFDLYESGFHVQNGFTFQLQAKKGIESFYYAQPQVAHRPEMDKLNQLAEAAKPDYLFAAYSGKFAAAFLQDIPQLNSPLKALYLPSMMALPEALAGVNALPMPARLAATWHPQMEEPFNLKWAAALTEKTGVQPSAFHLLGAEAGLMLESALSLTGGSIAPMKLAEALGAVSFEGPRGKLTVDSDTRSTQPFHHLFELQAAEGGLKPGPRQLMPQPDVKPLIEYYTGQMEMGWKNIFPTTH